MLTIVFIAALSVISILIVHTILRETHAVEEAYLPLTLLHTFTSPLEGVYRTLGWYAGLIASKVWDLAEYIYNHVFRAIVDTVYELWISIAPVFSFSEFFIGMANYLAFWRPGHRLHFLSSPRGAGLAFLGGTASSVFMIILQTILREAGVPVAFLPFTLLEYGTTRIAIGFDKVGVFLGMCIGWGWDVIIYLRDNLLHSIAITMVELKGVLAPLGRFRYIPDVALIYLKRVYPTIPMVYVYGVVFLGCALYLIWILRKFVILERHRGNEMGPEMEMEEDDQFE